MSKETILVVEDDEDIQELIRYNLGQEGYQVSLLSSGEQVAPTVRANRPQLVLLDIMLPGMDGLEVCRLLKRDSETESIPIVMLTAKGEDGDIVAGLELGADDYITKPFSPKVLIARIRTVLRRIAAKPVEQTDPVRIHNLVIHPGRHEVLIDSSAVTLTYTEFHLLHLLARRPGWVYTRNQIVESIRGTDYPVTERAVDVQVLGLRRKLGKAGDYIETVRGVGYRFRE